MERMVGTVVRGLRTPIIQEGDNLIDIIVDSVLEASEKENFKIQDRDVLAITESIVAIAQGNFASIDNVAKDVENKFDDKTIGVIFPILSRNRFSLILHGIAKGAKKIVLMLSYPSDEVGNELVDLDMLDLKGINPWTDVLNEKEFRENFSSTKHHFTGIDYIEYYKEIMEQYGIEYEIIFSNNPRTILDYTKNVIACDIHTRFRTERILKENGGEIIFTLDDILNSSVDGSGYNEMYGILGSNLATENTLKLFPRDCQFVVDKIQEVIKEKTGKTIEVMVYGDGAFKDPVGRIWELADPVVSPGFTSGLKGQNAEVKLKYLASNKFPDLKGEELNKAMTDYIKNMPPTSLTEMASQGTTPRNLTDLIGTLSDLTSGSGGKGTPIVYIQGYFDSFAE